MGWVNSLLNLIAAGVGAWSSWKQNASQAELDALSAAQMEENTLQSYQAMFINAFGSLSDAEAQASGLQGTIRSNRLQLKQTGANISAYNQAQSRLQTQFNYGLAAMKSQGRAQLNNLMAAYGNSSVASAARGHSGGSSALIEQMAKASVVEYVGADMRLDAQGGLYGYSLADYFLDSLASHKEIQGNKEIQEESFDIYYETMKQNMENLEKAEQNKGTAIEIMKDAYNKMAGFYGEDLDAAARAYQAEYDRVLGLMNAYDSNAASYEEAQDLLASWDSLKGLYSSYEDLQRKQDEAMAPFEAEWLQEYLGDASYQSNWGNTGDLFNTMAQQFDGAFGEGLRGVQAPVVEPEEEEEPAIDPNANFTGTRIEVVNGIKTEKKFENGLLLSESIYSAEGVLEKDVYYDATGKVSSEKLYGPSGEETKKDYEYKTNDQVDKVTTSNPDGSVKEENYWSNGNLESTKTENPDGTIVEEQYKDGVLKETSTTDSNGITTTEKYKEDGTVGNVTVVKPFVPPAKEPEQPAAQQPAEPVAPAPATPAAPAETPKAEEPKAEEEPKVEEKPAETKKEDKRSWWQKFTDWLGITNHNGSRPETNSTSSSSSSKPAEPEEEDSYYDYEDNEEVEEDQANAHFTGTKTSTVNGVTTVEVYRDGELVSTTIIDKDGDKEKDVVTAKDKNNKKPTEERM